MRVCYIANAAIRNINRIRALANTCKPMLIRMSRFHHTTIPNAVFVGREAPAYYAIFWFITCLFCVQVLFNGLRLCLGDKPVRWLLAIGLCYGLAMADAAWFGHVDVLGHADVVLMAVVFFAAGHLARQNQAKQQQSEI